MSTLRAREIFKNSTLMLLAVESIDFKHNQSDVYSQLYCKIEPIAVIVCTTDTSYAVDMESKPVVFEQLKQDVPGISTILSSFNHSRYKE